MLLDILIFLANLFLMRLLVNLFFSIFRQAEAGSLLAKIGILLFYLGTLVLPSVGAVLKRWPIHQRMKLRGEKEEADDWWLFGCLIIPAIYLAVNMFVSLAVALSFSDIFPDSEFGNTGGGALLGFGIIYNIFQTILVFRCFLPPKHKPKFAFLLDPRSEVLGDICIFVNMIFYQVILNYEASVFPLFHEGRFVDRFIPLVIFALLMYLTGRIFFLIEDIRHPRTLLTILLATSVVIVRTLIA